MRETLVNDRPVELRVGAYYRNGHGDVHGPMRLVSGVWMDENGILYHPDGRQWSHVGDSAGNLIANAKRERNCRSVKS